MPVLAPDEIQYDVLEGSGAPEATSADLKISEAVSLSERDREEAATLVEAFIEDDARARVLAEAVREGRAVVLDLIRPCVGRGRGKHLYTAKMLEANAQKFVGWKMYLNHLSDQARRALGGLPRDVRDLGGIVQEAWWNPDVPAEGRFGRGAVQSVSSPVPLIQELVKVDPRLVETSINATATACKPGKSGGEQVWIVEGIEEKGSVDWVTEAGAGGRVASIMEALIEDDSAVSGVLDTLDNGTILAWVQEHRPELAEALGTKKKPSASDMDEDDDDVEAAAKKLLDSGKAKTQQQALALAKRAAALKKRAGGNSGGGVSEGTHEEGDDVPDLTPEMLTEALASDEVRDALAEAIAPMVVEAVRSLNIGTEVLALVETKLGETNEVIRAEASARADRRGELRDLRDHAHRKIEESKLHPILKQQVKDRFDLIEGEPTAALDVVADEDDEGHVVKSARVKLDEAVTAEIAGGLKLMGELNPTRVRGQGPTSLTEGESKDKKEGEGGGDGVKKPDTIGPTTRSLLEANGIPAEDHEKVYARSL